MSALNVKVKINLKKYRTLVRSSAVNLEVVNQFRNEVIPMIRDLVATGRSPVAGHGRFEGYKNPDNYPGKGKNKLKPRRPVNLYLTGEMMKEYSAWKVDGATIKLGYDINSSRDLKDKVRANNEGTEHIPERRFIPINGEKFTVSVMRVVKNIFTQRLKRLFSK